MDWIEGIQSAIDYIEAHLCEKIDYGKVAGAACSSSYHFQRVFGIMCIRIRYAGKFFARIFQVPRHDAVARETWRRPQFLFAASPENRSDRRDRDEV